MVRSALRGICVVLSCAVLGAMSSQAQAGTMIKLNLGGVGPDIELAGGVLSTFDDGIAATTGDQNTAIEFTDFLDGGNPDINTSTASVTIDGLAISGSATVGPGFVTQAFKGGTISLYGPAPTNTLLLQGQLQSSSIFAATGPGGGTFFTTTFGNVTGGTLDAAIANNTLTMQMTLANVNGGAGVTAGAVMNPFLSDAFVTLDSDPAVPEPATCVFAVFGCVAAVAASKRRR